MEYVVFILGVLALAVFGVWRVRRGGSVDDPDRIRQGLPDDLRDKFTEGWGLPGAAPTIPTARPVSRESGSGEDGGG
ncbi:MAG TPA: hypothetical protein VNL94_09730 [Candidatus Binatia bacterium]|nr:hypothetical protein [Candidatus Binatia bacterium]